MQEFTLDHFSQNGFAVLPQESTIKKHISSLKKRALEIVKKADLKQASVFSTQNQTHLTDKYFFDSAFSVACFFEQDKNTVTKDHRINKIGHGLHLKDPIFQKFAQDALESGLFLKTGIKNPLIAQSMYIFKQPRIGGEVRPHRDASFIKTKPSSVTAFWWALDDARLDNGCLYVKPKSHKIPFNREFVACHKTQKAAFMGDDEPDTEGYIPVPCQKGSLIIMDGGLLHFSRKNSSPKARQAFTLHVVDKNQTTWEDSNWIPNLF